MADRQSKGGVGRLFAQAQQRRRERKKGEQGFHYTETGGGYGGYGGTADRGPFRPERGQFGAGYTDYGAHGHDPEPWRPRTSGPDSERTSDWFGADAGPERSAPGWYGGGVHEAREDRPAPDFGGLGGPAQGRFGRERVPGRGGGRGFGGPLGRWQDRDRGEQGRLFDGGYMGREDEIPIAGEAVAGRGHVGSDDFRDLAAFGEGRGDSGSHERFHERHEEGDHFRDR